MLDQSGLGSNIIQIDGNVSICYGIDELQDKEGWN